MTTRWNPFAANRHLTARVPIVGIEKVMRVQAAFAPMFAKSRLVRYGFLNGLPGFVTIAVGNSVKTTPGGGRWAGYGCLCRAQPGEAAAPEPRDVRGLGCGLRSAAWTRRKLNFLPCQCEPVRRGMPGRRFHASLAGNRWSRGSSPRY